MIHAPRQTQGRGNPHSQLKRAHARVQEEGGRETGEYTVSSPVLSMKQAPGSFTISFFLRFLAGIFQDCKCKPPWRSLRCKG